ncbi:MAG: winged helix-turn-helix transcriptional regulator [Thaumarchaeota archaeon]|nr:winged helix-turn-helix transcriptional regulator [Nitrososphaerota archaeon]
MSQLAEEIGLSESSIRRHLNNMLAEGIVEKIKYRGKVLWRLSGYGQLALDESAA